MRQLDLFVAPVGCTALQREVLSGGACSFGVETVAGTNRSLGWFALDHCFWCMAEIERAIHAAR